MEKTKFIEIPEKRNCTIRLSFKRANPQSDYIRILKFCREEPKTLQQIYPKAGYSAFAHEIIALAKQGYLRKLSTIDHIKSHVCPHRGIYNTYTKVWYSTTAKGNHLVETVARFTK